MLQTGQTNRQDDFDEINGRLCCACACNILT